MNAVSTLLGTVAQDVLDTFAENWPYLLIGIITAAALRTYVGSDRISGFLRGKTWMTVIAAVALATFTPFCSCGTEAVVLSLMAGSVPWAPIVAFMVSSPLTSPEELVMSGGLFGWTFALIFFIGATLLGLAAGFLTAWIEKQGWLAGQARMAFADAGAAGACCDTTPSQRTAVVGFLTAPVDRLRGLLPARGITAQTTTADSCCSPAPASTITTADASCCSDQPVLVPVVTRSATPGNSTSANPIPGDNLLLAIEPTTTTTGSSCCSDDSPAAGVDAATEPTLLARLRLPELAANLWAVARRILLFFFAFSALGYLIIRLLPSSLFSGFLGGDSAWAVITMAVVGIPLYITTDGSLPLVASLLKSGMSQGAAMAFLVTGAGTSLGAIAGALIIARWRVVGLVIGILFVGALIMGYGTQIFIDN